MRLRLPITHLDPVRRNQGRPGGTSAGRRWWRAVVVPLLLAAILPPAAPAGEIRYERDIAPILRTYCAGCHNDTDREGELSVETFASLRQGGETKGDPIKPGRAEDSFLIRSLEGRARPTMPPKDEPRVPAAELALLKRWIAEGARGPARDESILQTLVVPEVPPTGSVRPAFTAAALSPDGQQLALASHRRVEIRDAAGLRVRHALEGLPGKVNAVHFSPDGRALVTAGGIPGLRGVAQLWELKSGRLVRQFEGHRDVLYDAEFSPDGRLLATAGYDRAIRLWQAADGQPLRTIEVHNGAVFDLAFSPDGAVLASASADQTVKLWRVADGVRLDTLNQPQGELFKVAFTPDARYILAAGADRRLHLWRFVSREKPELNPVVMSCFAHETAITTFALTRDGRHLLTSALDRTLKVWSLPDLVERHAFAVQPDVASALVAGPRPDRFLAARMDGSLERYKLRVEAPRTAGRPAIPTAPGSPASTNVLELTEAEPNDALAEARLVTWPAQIAGVIGRPGDCDVYRFRARAGEALTLAINAARAGSKLDSRIEVLHLDGRPVEQVVLQAVRNSWFTFRGKDSDTSDDFRLHNWTEMELDEYLYANGEVVRLWLYPRGPDSGFKVYPGAGRRHTWFGTTAVTHALNEPCYIVTPLPPGTQPVPNGLPVFRLNYENDDDPTRRWGADSLLLFTAPADGEYLARVTDVRGFGGETNFHYTLSLRDRRPDFTVTIEGTHPKVSPGSGREIKFTAARLEGFDGPIRIEVTHLPPGFTLGGPVEIEAGQMSALAVLRAATNATPPDAAASRAVKVTASAIVRGRPVVHELGSLGEIKLAAPPKVTLEILPGNDPSVARATPGQPLELFIRPGRSITARVRATRHDFQGRIEMGNEDSGRNLPHGLYVDNIGLNGLLIVEGQEEREFFITAAPMARPGRRLFHLRTTADDGQASAPVWINVLPGEPQGMIRAAARN
ncbi:MAG TPA: c-type cytochrome domain-containing protein [Methylomirabilota bacterium]|nr:c-type cytochrome domain-containing protein [Methylomirabilota bacterium]